MLQDFLTPILDSSSSYEAYQIGHGIATYTEKFPELENTSVAFIGIAYKSANESASSDTCFHDLRNELYKLVIPGGMENRLVDLGNICAGERIEDTRKAVEVVTEELVAMGIIPVFFGGEKGYTEPIFYGLSHQKDAIDLSYVSSKIPLLEGQFLNRICTASPNHLLNLNVLGFQKHYIPPSTFDALENLGFNHMRLGQIKTNISRTEPLLRNTDMFIFDIGAIAQLYAPANKDAGISGLDSDMACQLSWYAGVSDMTKVYGVFEYDTFLDQQNSTAKLIAQMMWYFVDGIANRKEDHPALHSEFYKYRCNLSLNSPDILFFKSKRTDRWWMELPGRSTIVHAEEAVIPCTYEDYQTATYGDLPERYLKALQHLN